jgi:tetratricopeptide (TPR) repeat protein
MQSWTISEKKPAPTTDTPTSTERVETTEQKTAAAQKALRPLLDAKEYVAALDRVREEVRKGLPEQAIAEDYLAALNGTLQQAEHSQADEDYAEAGRLFKTVQENTPGSAQLQAKVDRTPAQVSFRIDTCAERLMAKGLVAYRSGLFKTAIKFWEQILVFQPQNTAAQKAIQTTKLQQANLKRLDSSL